MYPQRLFYVIVASASNPVIDFAKHQRVATMSPLPSEIPYINTEEYSPYLPPSTTVDSDNVVSFKPAPDRLEQIKKHRTVQQTDNDRLIIEWRDKVAIAIKYEEHLPAFLQLLEEFVEMWDIPLGSITFAKRKTELTDNNLRPVHSALHRTI